MLPDPPELGNEDETFLDLLEWARYNVASSEKEATP